MSVFKSEFQVVAKCFIAAVSFVTALTVILLTLASCGRAPNNVRTDGDALSISIAAEEQLLNGKSINYYDEAAMSTDWKIAVTVNGDIESLLFVEIDDSDETVIGRTLFEAHNVKQGSTYIFHTYINDAALNRGIRYKDKNGNVKTFASDVSMKDGTVYFKELDL